MKISKNWISRWKKTETEWNEIMISTFNITKTFEQKQKTVRGSLDLLVIHSNFWGELPIEYTKHGNVSRILRTGWSVKIQVPGYKDFFIKAIEYGDTRNRNYLLCGFLANTRQWWGVAGAYLTDPDEIELGNLILLRNSNRHLIRKFVVHFQNPIESDTQKISLKWIMDTEIKSLAILDKKIDLKWIMDTQIKSLSILDKKIF